MASRHAHEIGLGAFKEILAQYGDHIPPKLTELERFRMDELPASLQTRMASKQQAHLTKDELVKLVEWKLKHGTFRPKLLSLVQSNTALAIEQTTTAAFTAHLAARDAYTHANALTSLRGVGIATGSLALSAVDAQHVPFFGDEVFRWLMWREPVTGGGGAGAGKGWSRKIAYTAKEYRRFVEVVDELRGRLGVSAIEIEQVGYVLGRLNADLDGEQTAQSPAAGQKRKTDAIQSQDVASKRHDKRQKSDVVVSNAAAESSRRTRSSTKHKS